MAKQAQKNVKAKPKAKASKAKRGRSVAPLRSITPLKLNPSSADAEEHAQHTMEVVPRQRSVPAEDGQPSDAKSGSRGKYVYCIIRTGDPLIFASIGIGVDPSYFTTVNFKDLAA